MMPPTSFSPGDTKLLGLMAERSEDLRALLCLLAQLGVRWRRAEGDLCSDWLAALGTHPFYKGGQVLFDLLEFEDFMLDGAAPLVSITTPLDRLQAQLDRIAAALGLPSVALVTPAALPELEAGFYLYRDVVLGLLSLVREA